MSKAVLAAENFISRNETIAGVEKYGRGIIHDTYLVKLENRTEPFILQRINTQVFTNPEAMMHNLRLVCQHIRGRMMESGGRIEAGWQMAHPLPASDGRDFFIDADGAFWRALSFIRQAVPLEAVGSLDDAEETGRAHKTIRYTMTMPVLCVI